MIHRPDDTEMIADAPPHRILYVIDTLEVGGTETSLLELASRLDRDRFEPHVCAVYSEGRLSDAFSAAGVPVTCLEIPGKYRFGTAVRRLSSLVRQLQPHIVHTSLFRASQVGRYVGWRFGATVVSSFVNAPYDQARFRADPKTPRLKLKMLQALDTLTARCVDRFHSVSTWVRESNCRSLRVSQERVTVIPRGRQTGPRIERTPAVLAARREQLGLPTAATIILNVGRLNPAKGQRTLISAMPSVLASHPDALLLIAGDGLLRNDLAEAIAREGLGRHVRLLGHRSDVNQLLAASDIFAFPSFHEGLPGAVVEAMFSGLPIVASDIPVHREVLEHGHSGVIVSGDDSVAVAAALSQLLSDAGLRERLGMAARLRAEQHYEISDVVASTERFYSEILSRPTPDNGAMAEAG